MTNSLAALPRSVEKEWLFFVRKCKKQMDELYSVLPCQHSAIKESLGRPTSLIRQAPFRKVQSMRPGSKVFGRAFWQYSTLYTFYILLCQILQKRRLEALAADGHALFCSEALSWHEYFLHFSFPVGELGWISTSPVPQPIVWSRLQ